MNNIESEYKEEETIPSAANTPPITESTSTTPTAIEQEKPEDKQYIGIVTDKINESIKNTPETQAENPITPEQVETVVKENKEKPENLAKIQEKLGVFKECNDWNEVGQKVGKAVIEWQKERMLIGLVVAGVIVAVVEPTPVMEFLIGPALVTVGWEKSKYLQKIVPKEVVTKFMKIDPVKAFRK